MRRAYGLWHIELDASTFPDLTMANLAVNVRGFPLLAVVFLFTAACGRRPTASNVLSASSQLSTAVAENRSYLERLAAFHTHLSHAGPAPQDFQVESPPAGVQEVTYASGALKLKAWVAYPANAPVTKKVPAVAYFHGGFAFGAADFDDARPFLEAGFAVMCPTLRGENGNPGTFEMYLGEVNDAKAAIAWLATNERIDHSRLYAFGHSAGGVISALLSLHETPLRHSGSAGGLYGPKSFDRPGFDLPFFVDEPGERELRVLIGNVRWMQHPHYAFVGEGDHQQAVAAARNEMRDGHGRLAVTVLPGDHFTSLPASVAAYVQAIRDNP
jgi:acetyl esterase/lipase